MKHWVMYILASLGLLVAVLWAYRRLSGKTVPYTREPQVVVDIPDTPEMEGVHFDSSKPAWDPSFFDKIPLQRSLTTTYVKR